MTGIKLLSAILRGAWLIDPRYAEGYMGNVAKMLSGEPVSFFNEKEIDNNKEKHKPVAVSLIGGKLNSYKSYDDAPAGSIAVLTHSGPILKEDSCGIPGTQTMRQRTIDAYAHPNIGARIMRMDSGGGSVDGTFEYADVVADKKKPVIAFVDGLAASAGYAIICGATEIYASHKTAEIGSIGTAITLYDNKANLEKWGYKMHYIKADSSPDKNQDYFKALENDYSQIKKNILNPTNAIFQQTVKTNRSGKLEMKDKEPLTGKVYLADEAAKLGLIDGIKTFEDVVDRAQELATAHTETIKPNNKTEMKFSIKSGLKALAAFFGVSAEEGKTTEVEMTPEKQVELNAKLERVSGLEDQVTNLNTKVTELNNSLTTKTKEAETLTAQVTQLQADLKKATETPGAEITKPVKTGKEELAEGAETEVDPVTKEMQDLIGFSFEKTTLKDNPSFANNEK